MLHDRFQRIGAFVKVFAADFNIKLFGFGILRRKLHIRLVVVNDNLQLAYLLGQGDLNFVLHTAVVIDKGVTNGPQSVHLVVNLKFPHDHWIVACDGFDLSVIERCFVDVVGGTLRVMLGGHNGRNKLLLAFYHLIHKSVKGSFGYVVIYLHGRIAVSLSDNTSFALLNVGRTVRAI